MSGAAPTGHGSNCVPDLAAAVVRASVLKEHKSAACHAVHHSLHGSVVRVSLVHVALVPA